MPDTALAVSSCTDSIRVAISRVESAVLSARLFTCSATTAKALPCSPAWDAMMAAFSESRLVCSAMPSITFTISPIDSDRLARLVMVFWSASNWLLISRMPVMVSPTAFMPSSASWAVFSESSWLWEAFCSTCCTEVFSSCTEAVVLSVASFRISTLRATSLMLWVISTTELEVISIDSDRLSMLPAISPTAMSICMMELEVSLAESASRSAFLFTLRIEPVTLSIDSPASRTASSWRWASRIMAWLASSRPSVTVRTEPVFSCTSPIRVRSPWAMPLNAPASFPSSSRLSTCTEIRRSPLAIASALSASSPSGAEMWRWSRLPSSSATRAAATAVPRASST